MQPWAAKANIDFHRPTTSRASGCRSDRRWCSL